MQTNDSRLIKAAKRTIRAEVTLILVIIVIASWSVYALYKLAFGGADTVFGLSLTKLTTPEKHGKLLIEQQGQKSSTSAPANSSQPVKSVATTGYAPIYLASNAASTPITHGSSDQLSNIRSLILNQSPNRHLLLGNGLHPIASHSPVLSAYNHNPMNQPHSTNPNQQFPNRLMSAQLVQSAGGNLYGGNNVPIGRPSIGAQAGRELDYESNSPDYGPAPQTSLDYSNDRQAEESNRDPGESVMINSSPLADADEEQDINSTSAEAQDDSDEVAKDDLQPETTTSSPPTNESNETNPDQDPSTGSTDYGDGAQPQDDPEEPATEERDSQGPEDEQSLKAAGLSIDEEVDRMTQPSVGSISQQDTPFSYTNTVQFDDSPARHEPTAKIPRESGTQVAHFADPQARHGASSKKQAKGEESDLQVDHDTVRVGPSQPRVPSKRHARPIKGEFRNKSQSRDAGKVAAKSISPKDKNSMKKAPILGRQKRHLAKNVIRAPYEIDGVLNDLHIDNFIEQSFGRARQLNRANSDRQPEGPLEMASSEVRGKRAYSNGRKKKRAKMKNELMRRSDEEDEDEDEDDGEGEPSGQDENGAADDSSPARSHQSNGPQYHYITSNDTALQDLLARQHLLDALKNSQLPAPTLGATSEQQPNQTGTVIAGGVQAVGHQQVMGPARGADHQPAGSLYSVDHGLLLYPAANDDYSSKSMSKKKKKHAKKREKKKLTVAVKKGGHKKKKHKKEEKKFIKEKKFKGAKKGKKVSKGKGGQGGKKGKKLYKDKGFKKKGFKNVYHKEEFGQKKSYFDEFRDKDFKKKWKKFDDKYNYAQMKKWQAKDVKGAKKVKDHGEKFKKYDKGKWKKKYHKQSKEQSESSKKAKKSDGF